MKIRIVITIASVLLICQSASAFIFGIRYSNLNEPVLDNSGFSAERGRFGGFIGYTSKNNIFLAGLDYDRHRSQRGDTTFYARRFTVNIGYRYQVFPPSKISATKINPFFSLHLFRSFPKVEADDLLMTPQQRQYTKDMLNDSGGWISFGAEYFFARAFSLGAEAGIRYAHAKSNALGYDVKITDYTSFVAILMVFYWQ